MLKRFVILILAGFNVHVSVAQIPELNVVREYNPSDYKTTIEKARVAYNAGQYKDAETYYFEELDEGILDENDYLLFANALIYQDKASLASEFYETYFKQNANKKKQQKAQLSMLLKTNEVFLKREVLVENDLKNPSLGQNTLYGSDNGKLISYEFDCSENIANRKELFTSISGMEIGSITYFNEGNSAVVSLLNSSVNKFGLYLLLKKREKWLSPIKLLADKNYNYAFPMVDEINKMLYFSSDAKDGFGGYDIYQSVLGAKSIETPINLGELINTSCNEISPYKDENWLYFSTDGKLSKGGFDIYKFKSLSETNYIIQNYLDVNTKEDDLTYLPFSQEKSFVGHIVDNRYVLSSVEKATQIMFLNGLVLDTELKPIENAIILIELDDSKGKYTKTDDKGSYSIQIDEKHSEIKAQVMADGFVKADVDIIKTKDIILRLGNENDKTEARASVSNQTQINSIIDKSSKNSIENKTVKNTAKGEFTPTQFTNPKTHAIQDAYYIIIGSAVSKNQAQEYMLNWVKVFDNLEILESENGRFRIGFYAGISE